MKNMKLSRLVFLAILGAWAIVLRTFDFPILPAAPFLKIDFSDLMVLIGLLANGPIGAIIVAGTRDLLNYIMGGGQAGLPIGVIMSFIASMAMFLPSHFILSNLKQLSIKFKYVLMSISLVTFLVISMAIFNYYIALPWYVAVLNFPIPDLFVYVVSIIIPFNLIKGVFLIFGQLAVFKTLVPLMKKRNMLYKAYSLEKKSVNSSDGRLSQLHG